MKYICTGFLTGALMLNSSGCIQADCSRTDRFCDLSSNILLSLFTQTSLSSEPVYIVITGSGSNNNGLYRSTDGQNWTEISYTVPAGFFQGIVYANGIFAAVTGNAVHISSDGLTWSGYSIPDGGQAITFGNGRFVSVDDSGGSYSTDAINWTVAGGVAAGDSRYGVAYNGSQFFAGGVTGHERYSSDNGATWLVPGGGCGDLDGVASGNGRIVAIGESSDVCWSDDPSASMTSYSNAAARFTKIAYQTSSGRFYGAGSVGVKYSPDGTNGS